jgi:hypothetical protein
MTEPTVEVVPDPARNRFEIHVDGTSVGECTEFFEARAQRRSAR